MSWWAVSKRSRAAESQEMAKLFVIQSAVAFVRQNCAKTTLFARMLATSNNAAFIASSKMSAASSNVKSVERAKTWPSILLLGDSITQRSFQDGGWGESLAEMLRRKCEVASRGFNGYTTRTAVMYKDMLLDAKTAENLCAAVVFYGTNDSALPGAYSHGHVPLDEYGHNLKELLGAINKLGLDSSRIIMVTPPPADTQTWNIEKKLQGYGADPDRKNSITVEYAATCRKVATAHQCRLVDFWEMINNRRDTSIYFSDGLHLSKLGNKVLFDALAPHVEELTRQLPEKLPDWKTL